MHLCGHCSKSVVTNLSKPKIPDLGLYERQDLPIDEFKGKTSQIVLSIWGLLFSILISDAPIIADSGSDFFFN